mmetsp:Transcript_8986/g.26434  ORF Transcript_8986/g.26434 Transcript_8986/m.26434 type:complete len:209 (-) Transcript_8986:112-738(-)
MTTSTTRPLPFRPLANSTSCAMLSDSVYRAQLMSTTRDRCARSAPTSSIRSPSTTPARLSMKGSERQPAPIADETSVNTAARRDPSPSGSSTCETIRDIPTLSSRGMSSGVWDREAVNGSSLKLSMLWLRMFLRISFDTGDLAGAEKSSHSHFHSSSLPTDPYSRSLQAKVPGIGVSDPSDDQEFERIAGQEPKTRLRLPASTLSSPA